MVWSPCLRVFLAFLLNSLGHSVLPDSSTRAAVLETAGAACCYPIILNRREAAPALPPAPASRFTFKGPLAPVVMVSSSGSSVPWCCPIDSFTGEEDVPQVRTGRGGMEVAELAQDSCALQALHALQVSFSVFLLYKRGRIKGALHLKNPVNAHAAAVGDWLRARWAIPAQS